MKIMTYLKQLRASIRKPKERHQSDVGRMGGVTVRESDAEPHLQAGQKTSFGADEAGDLHVMKRQTRRLVEEMQEVSPVRRSVSVPANQLARALRRLIGSIRAAFHHCFVPTPVNVALLSQLNELDCLLEQGAKPESTIDSKRLDKFCKSLKKLTRRKDLNRELSPLVNYILGLTTALAKACKQGEAVVTVPVVQEPVIPESVTEESVEALIEEPAEESVEEDGQDVPAVSEQALNELLNDDGIGDDEYEDALEHPYRSGVLPALSSDQIATALNVVDPEDAPGTPDANSTERFYFIADPAEAFS